MEIQDRSRGGPSHRINGPDIWRVIWNLRVPNTVKHVLWRAYNNLLPTKDNLLQRRVVADNKCPCCEKEDESIFHALWRCPAAQDVWGGGSVVFQKCVSAKESFSHVMEGCIQRFNKENLDLMVVISKRIWLRRKRLVFEGVFTQPSDVFKEVVNSLANFRGCNSRKGQQRTPRDKIVAIPPAGWMPPPSGFIKINSDTSIDQ